MDETELKNGVLIYLVEDRNFVICGDQGINDVVPNDFGIVRDVMVAEFKRRFQTRTY
jgi:uncharacterized membrane protein